MLLPRRIMGCGRSKHHSRENSMTDMSEDPKAKRGKVSSKQDKKKSVDKKENQEPVAIEKVIQNSNKVLTSKQVESGVLKSRRTNPSHNGTLHQTVQSEIRLSVKEERILHVPDEKYSKPLGHKEKTGDGPNQYIRVTNSQLEFFKMLDEKIEQGQDYYTDSDESFQEEAGQENVIDRIETEK